MTSYCPSSQDLLAYCSGSLSTGDSVAIAAHLEYCSSCSKKAEQFNAQTAQEWNDAQPEQDFDLDEFAPMLDAILNTPLPDVPETFGPGPDSARIAVGDQLFEVPPVLGKLAQSGLKWRKLPGGVSLANIKVDNETLCSFLYMKPGGRVAMHTHEGTETTLVIGGSFRDAAGEYRQGDFIQRSEEHTHSSESDEGCLCFTVQDNPVVFTKGLSRLFNPINRHLMRG